MKLTGPALMAAALLVGAPAFAQSENEIFHAVGTQLQNEQREVLQHNIEMATKALQEKDYATARKYAQPVTRSDPKRREAWIMLGTAQMGLQDWKKARDAFSTAVRMFPTDPESHAGLGIAMAKLGDPRATVHLAWLNDKIAACGTCWQASQLAKFKGDVELAIRQAPPPKG